MKSELMLVYCSVHVARVAGTEFLAIQMQLYVRTKETRGPKRPFQVYKRIKATPTTPLLCLPWVIKWRFFSTVLRKRLTATPDGASVCHLVYGEVYLLQLKEGNSHRFLRLSYCSAYLRAIFIFFLLNSLHSHSTFFAKQEARFFFNLDALAVV